jgi:hypothetical protein
MVFAWRNINATLNYQYLTKKIMNGNVNTVDIILIFKLKKYLSQFRRI